MVGEWPENDIDHRNLVRHDNSWTNLRSATRQENAFNRPVRSNNVSGIKGVAYNERLGKWTAAICAGGRQMHIGCFATASEASGAYAAAARYYFGEFARSR